MVSRHYNGFQALYWFLGTIMASRHYTDSRYSGVMHTNPRTLGNMGLDRHFASEAPI